MSKFKRKGGRTTRATRKREGTIDEEEAPQSNVGQADPLVQAAEQGIRKTINWLTKTQNQGGLSDWFVKNIEKAPPENPKCDAYNANHPKNRSQEVPCLDVSRVKLQEVPDASKDYIHANYVKLPKCDRNYILTQHPLESTLEDFWRMVFYEPVDTIISVLSADESLNPYFPNENGRYENRGIFFLNCRKVTPMSTKYGHNAYTIEVLPEGCSNSKMVTVLQYTHWPKGNVPANMRVIMKLLRAVKTDKASNYVVVHCTNGINRAGCVVLADYIIDIMFRNIEVEMLQIVRKLRNQRAQLVQSKVCFLYSISVAIEYVKLRLKRSKTHPDLLKEIEDIQQQLSKEFASVTAKEPPIAGKKKANETIEE